MAKGMPVEHWCRACKGAKGFHEAECQCEHAMHLDRYPPGCPNVGDVQVSAAYRICKECADTMAPSDLYWVTDTGPYAGLAWHMDDEDKENHLEEMCYTVEGNTCGETITTVLLARDFDIDRPVLVAEWRNTLTEHSMTRCEAPEATSGRRNDG